MIRLRFRDTAGYDADAHFGYELHRNAGTRIRALEVVDELLQVLDGVNVVMRRRRNEADASSRVTGSCDGSRDLVTRKLATLTRLCPLRHFDLKLVSISEIIGGHAETPRRDLLDCGSHGVPVVENDGALRVFATFSRVRLPAKAIHGDSERGMCLHRDRPIRHGTSNEPPHDFIPRFYLFNGDGCGVLVAEFQKTTELDALGLLIGVPGIGVVSSLVSLPYGVL
jgi:hypothetical protein